MKNSELIRCTSDRLLTGLDKQRRLILREYSVQQGCPNCGTQQNVFEATGVDVDAWDCNRGGETVGTCSGCGRRLLLIVPFMVMAGPHWRWQLVPITPRNFDDEIEDRELHGEG